MEDIMKVTALLLIVAFISELSTCSSVSSTTSSRTGRRGRVLRRLSRIASRIFPCITNRNRINNQVPAPSSHAATSTSETHTEQGIINPSLVRYSKKMNKITYENDNEHMDELDPVHAEIHLQQIEPMISPASHTGTHNLEIHTADVNTLYNEHSEIEKMRKEEVKPADNVNAVQSSSQTNTGKVPFEPMAIEESIFEEVIETYKQLGNPWPKYTIQFLKAKESGFFEEGRRLWLGGRGSLDDTVSSAIFLPILLQVYEMQNVDLKILGDISDYNFMLCVTFSHPRDYIYTVSWKIIPSLSDVHGHTNNDDIIATAMVLDDTHGTAGTITFYKKSYKPAHLSCTFKYATYIGDIVNEKPTKKRLTFAELKRPASIPLTMATLELLKKYWLHDKKTVLPMLNE